MNINHFVLMGAGVMAAAVSFADVKPASIFSDNMVFQADMPLRVWGSADAGENVKVSFMGKSAKAKADNDGRWQVELPKSSYVREGQTLTIEGKNKVELNDVLVGEVWLLSGQSNMEWAFESVTGAKETLKGLDNPQIRFFNIKKTFAEEPLGPHGINPEIVWQKCNEQTAKRMSGVGVLFGMRLNKDLDVPVGLILAANGGSRLETWMDRDAMEASGELEWALQMEKGFIEGEKRDQAKREEMTEEERRKRGWHINIPNNRNSILARCYNAMINPLEPLAMRGELWYQGEMNTGNRRQYANMFPKYAQMMRAKFKNPDLYIYTVQLPDYDNKDWPGTREAQRQAAIVDKKGGMAVTIDGHEMDLHPRDKNALSKRLSEMALADVYGKKYDSHSPIAPKAKLAGNIVKIKFDNAYKGLKTNDGQAPRTFQLSDDGKNFADAEAKVTGKDEVSLKMPDGISAPVLVRYGWAADPDVNLTNSADLPVSPFEEEIK